MNSTCFFHSPIGWLKITGSDNGISEIIFVGKKPIRQNLFIKKNIQNARNQIEKYFQNDLKNFTIKLDQTGTNFQHLVWNELTKIRYGTTKSYQQLAIQIKDKKSTRAVASAISKNKLAIVIPCHRIIGSNNKLKGYAWNLKRKKWLLEFENNTRQFKLL